MRRFLFLIALLAIALSSSAQHAQAQFFGGYGAGFTPSPQASYGPNGAVTGALYPNGVYVGSGGYVPPGPVYGYPMPAYGGMSYGYRPMPLGQAIATAAVITAVTNRGYGRGYPYQPYTGYGMRGGFGGVSRHQLHEMREHGR